MTVFTRVIERLLRPIETIHKSESALIMTLTPPRRNAFETAAAISIKTINFYPWKIIAGKMRTKTNYLSRSFYTS